MADKPSKSKTTAKSVKASAKTASAPKAKRLVRDPETFRERAVKAAEQDGKPTRKGLARSAGSKVISPARKAASTVGSKKAFKPVRVFFRILGKVLVPPYFRNSWKELRQVSWLSFRESVRLTWAVLIFAVVFGVVIAVVDYGLDKLFRNILLK